MPKKLDWVVCEPRLRYAPNTPEGIALSYVKNHPSFKSARDLLAQAMVAYWLPFALAASGVKGQALIMACFEAIGELEKQINLIKRVLLDHQTVNCNDSNAPQKVVYPKIEETFSSIDAKSEDMAMENSVKETAAVGPKKAADLF
ncbi:hypothetical protein H6S82_00225 [Planktothrix sp. FACHB-1355]|uniref:Uncharacterized protein n=1 Tax=Aerosakkonema funiforme FACHB-1375 TaxID=2949571 RepID=A0A926VDI7_9CYAN|nr:MULTISPECIES: hypothetical protein [Oscillatoriales]MBD2181879.1 hypothetical protein [Aerosakkonema funiforme FACHB-1375]MBD3557299.1 hypothetical protein [Planktothrix sp. FACHB-1355]